MNNICFHFILDSQSDIQSCFQFPIEIVLSKSTFQWNLQISKPVYTSTKVEHLRECLRSLKREHKVKHYHLDTQKLMCINLHKFTTMKDHT